MLPRFSFFFVIFGIFSRAVGVGWRLGGCWLGVDGGVGRVCCHFSSFSMEALIFQ